MIMYYMYAHTTVFYSVAYIYGHLLSLWGSMDYYMQKSAYHVQTVQLATS